MLGVRFHRRDRPPCLLKRVFLLQRLVSSSSSTPSTALCSGAASSGSGPTSPGPSALARGVAEAHITAGALAEMAFIPGGKVEEVLLRRIPLEADAAEPVPRLGIARTPSATASSTRLPPLPTAHWLVVEEVVAGAVAGAVAVAASTASSGASAAATFAHLARVMALQEAGGPAELDKDSSTAPLASLPSMPRRLTSSSSPPAWTRNRG